MKIEKLENPFIGLHVGYSLSLDDVIRKVNEIIDALNGKEDPELRESEDERIRKGIISLVLKVMGQEKDNLSDDKYDAILAWLEKQKEPENTSASTMIPSCWTQCDDNRFWIIERAKKDILEKTNIKSSPDEMKVLDNILFRAWQMGWLSKYDVIVPEQKPVKWSEKHIADVFEKVGLSKIVREIGNDDLTNAVQSAMIELSKGNSKEWSEGDEKHLNNILDAIDYWGTTSGQDILLDADINWLKSRRPPKKEDLPRWRKIRAGEKIPCFAYLYKLAYETENNFLNRATVDGLLIPNEPVTCGCDTWYLPVDEIKNLPKED